MLSVPTLLRSMFVAALDPFYLGVTAIVTVGWQTIGFLLMFYVLQSDIIQDAWSSVNFSILVLLTLNLGAAYNARNIIATIFVLVWAIRLGGFQLFRISRMGGDARFDDMRGKFMSLLGFWCIQAVWVWTVACECFDLKGARLRVTEWVGSIIKLITLTLLCLQQKVPVNVLNSPAVSRSIDGYGGRTVDFGTGCDIAGIILWVLGYACEVAADVQKYRHKMVNNPPKGALCDSGVWYFSRRPNYFGEILLWWGIWLLVISPAVYNGNGGGGGVGNDISKRGHDVLLGSIVSPLFTMALLIFLSGIPLAEKPSQEKYYLMSYGVDGGKQLEPYGKTQQEADPWKRMKGYRERTSLLLPLPPQLYKPLPRWIKSTLLLDLPMFRFDEDKDGPKAIESERRKKNQGDDAA